VLFFWNDGSVAGNDECLGVNRGRDDFCSSATNIPTDIQSTFGPMPEGGATVSNLFVQIDAADSSPPTPGVVIGLQIMDVLPTATDGTGTITLTCTMTWPSTPPANPLSCSDSRSFTIAQGHYIRARVTESDPASNDVGFRASIRF
jgi:hypothetical protein